MEHYKKEYIRLVKEFWGEDLKDVKVSVSEMEIPFEVSPCSVNEIASYCINNSECPIRSLPVSRDMM